MISVIVPTHNEEALLPACLESITCQQADKEIIVVDGASNDRTLKLARSCADKVISLDKAGLPAQLNADANQARGEILLFLHADCRLAPGSLDRLKALSPRIVGGAFTMQLDGKKIHYRVLSLGGNIYCRFTGTYFGDRGMFVRASVFRDLGGFAALPIMADVDFSHRLRGAGKRLLLKGPVISSTRKFDDESPWRNLYLIIYALLAFRFRVDPGRIKQ